MTTTIPQDVYLGFMSSADNWNYFVNTLLPQVATGQVIVIGADGHTPASTAQVMAATQDAGNNLGGLAIPQAVIDTVNAPPAPAATVPAPQMPTSAGSDIDTELAQWGLGNLAPALKQHIAAGESSTQIEQWIRGTAEYAARFPAMKMRADKGLPPITEAEYIALERSYSQAARSAGLLPGSYDATTAIGNDVSPSEFAQRVNDAATAIYKEPEDTRVALQQYYGLTPGQLASYYLNPENAVPKLQQMLAAGQIGGIGMSLGVNVDRSIAEEAAQAGVSQSTARSGLAKVAADRQLFDESISETQDLTEAQGIEAQLGLSGQSLLAFQNRQAKRAAIGQGGGGSATTTQGLIGAGVAR